MKIGLLKQKQKEGIEAKHKQFKKSCKESSVSRLDRKIYLFGEGVLIKIDSIIRHKRQVE